MACRRDFARRFGGDWEHTTPGKARRQAIRAGPTIAFSTYDDGVHGFGHTVP